MDRRPSTPGTTTGNPLERRPLIEVIPQWPGGLPEVTSPSEINRTATPASERQLNVAALNSPIPLPYGIARLPALMCNILAYQATKLVFWVIWGRGPMLSIDSITCNDLPLPEGSVVTSYTGAAGQGVDATLAAAFLTVPGMPAYTETLPGLAYSVITIPAHLITGEPQFNAIGHWRLAYDPRQDSTNGGSGAQRANDSTSWGWTRNPTLILCDFLRGGARYGAGLTPDWPSVAACADLNEATVGSGPSAEVSRYADFVIDKELPEEQWITTLRNAASVWLVPNGSTVKFVPDAWGASTKSYGHALGNVLKVSAEEFAPADQLPTVMEVIYTDSSSLPWRDAVVTPVSKIAGVDDGSVPYVKATVRMPWILRHSQAYREQVERLNKLHAGAFSMRLDVMDEGIEQEPGDPIDLTYPDSGYDELPLRVRSAMPTADGWALLVGKLDPSQYSTDVLTGPVIPNTNLPLPTAPTAPAGISVVEERFAKQDKTRRSRIRGTVTAPSGYPYAYSYRWRVWDGTTLVWTGTTPDVTIGSAEMEEGKTYVVTVTTFTAYGESTPIAASISILGKLLPPPDVASFSISQFGPWVIFTWSKVEDIDAIKRYLIKRWPHGAGSWATGTVVDAVDALALRSTSEPSGDWDYGVVAIDSTERESQTPKVVRFQVAADDGAQFVGAYAYVTPTLTNMTSYVTRDGVTHYVTNHGDQWGTLFGGSPMSTYTNPVDSYHTAGDSILETEWFDVGVMVGGQWTANATYSNDDGTADFEIDLSPDGITGITTYSGGSAKGSGRFARVRISTTRAVRIDGMPSITITANPREETFSGTSSGAGPVTITLVGKYFKKKDCVVNVEGSTLLKGMAANFTLSDVSANTFEVVVLDETNTRQVADFTGTFKGIAY